MKIEKMEKKSNPTQTHASLAQNPAPKPGKPEAAQPSFSSQPATHHSPVSSTGLVRFPVAQQPNPHTPSPRGPPLSRSTRAARTASRPALTSPAHSVPDQPAPLVGPIVPAEIPPGNGLRNPRRRSPARPARRDPQAALLSGAPRPCALLPSAPLLPRAVPLLSITVEPSPRCSSTPASPHSCPASTPRRPPTPCSRLQGSLAR